MIAETHLRRELSFSFLQLDLYPVGEDIAALLSGGARPHIGCTVIALPRPSLTGDGSASCTSSVVNLTGHKDEALCRRAAEALCKRYGVTVTCSGGFHKDRMTPGEIREVLDALREMLEQDLVATPDTDGRASPCIC